MSRDLVWVCTIGPVDAGIVGVLEEAYRARTGVQVRHIAAGSGEALKTAESGGADLVMTHARALEEQFIRAGYGIARHDLMFNDFVIVGPAADPAGIRGSRREGELHAHRSSHLHYYEKQNQCCPDGRKGRDTAELHIGDPCEPSQTE